MSQEGLRDAIRGSCRRDGADRGSHRASGRGSVVVGAASLVAAAGHITPRAGDSHPALLARHVLSMLKTTRSSFPACLGINSFQNYSAEIETLAPSTSAGPPRRATEWPSSGARALLQPRRRRSIPCSVRCLGQHPRRPFMRPTGSSSRSTFRRTGALWTCSLPIWMLS